jgi:hypothetical protein
MGLSREIISENPEYGRDSRVSFFLIFDFENAL